MTHYAFIFARGGSKGLPKKNTLLLSGIPLIAHSIKTAQSTPEISKIFVSTDDNTITEIAHEYGVEVILRPKELAQDNSPEWLAWQHAISFVNDKYGAFDSFVSLPATSPLRSVKDVSDSIAKLHDTDGDICISVAEASRNPYFNMVTLDDVGNCQIVNQSNGKMFRRQDAPSVFDITTVVYTSSPQFILSHQGLFEGKVVAIKVPKERAVDIDDIYDFTMAEAIIKCHLSND